MTDAELKNENLKLQIQLINAQSEASKPKWLFRTAIVSSIGVPILTLLIQLVLHWYELDGQVKTGEKVVAAVEVVKEQNDGIAHDTAINTAINTGYEARRTEAPDDMAKADAAQAKVMAQESPAVKVREHPAIPGAAMPR